LPFRLARYWPALTPPCRAGNGGAAHLRYLLYNL
jgi:hypothetical protein